MYNLRLNKNIGALALASTIALTTVGCGEEESPKLTVAETMQETQNFDLLNDTDKLIITTIDAMGKEEMSFVHRECLDALVNPNQRRKYQSSEEYGRYHRNGYYLSDIYLYFDALEGDLISVEYIERDKHVFKDNEVNTSYMISEIVDSKPAYNYAILYYGDQDSYSREEMQDLIPMIIDDKLEKRIGSK